jgi:hypothetical protein
MPDPVLFAKAMIAAGAVSALVVASGLSWNRPAGAVRSGATWLLGLALAMIVGTRLLSLAPHWPPRDGLDRLLFVIFPVALTVELIGRIPRVPRWATWILRGGLAASAGRILLHGSSYLDGSASDWTIGEIRVALVIAAGGLMVVWWALDRLVQRSPGISISLAVAEVSVAAGLALMLSGYATGGQAALPLAAGLVGVAVATWVCKTAPATPGVLGVGLVGLFGILILGRFFGELTTGRAIALFLAPLLAWGAELSALRGRKPWQVAATRMALVTIPIAIVLFLAQQDFASKSAAAGADEYEMYKP